MSKAILTIAGCTLLMWAGAAGAITTCKAKIHPSDGIIRVTAHGVSGTLLWGNTAATATNALPGCDTSSGNAVNCTLGSGAVAITPPPLCTLYLKDGSGPCAAYIKSCTPGARPAAAPATRFVDNGDGTVSDTQTGLMWEKKTGTVGSPVDCSMTTCADPQNVNNTYQWCQDGNHNHVCDHYGIYSDNPPDGGAFGDFLARTNGALCPTGDCPGLGGHTDWRLPTTSELLTIVAGPPCNSSPCIDPTFGTTQSGSYWSNTTTGAPSIATVLNFGNGSEDFGDKFSGGYVRAVRGGL